ncbi:MAG: hypothetical protein CMD88_02870 [Gammaproteobacteria bacterium]|nr:hypothetical protein [Gammaproteobacteria bacterium]|tara:strand:- start:884 stop:1243 length:360 start_codon:yes stop_codon:yes gene_type:complete
MDRDKIKQTEILYFIKSFLKKDYPRYLSKNFSHNVINNIKKSSDQKNVGFFMQFATAASVAIVTLFFIKFATVTPVEFSKKPETIINQNPQTYNVTNDNLVEECDTKDKNSRLSNKNCQ